jgi:hypothetical protein
VALRVQVEVLVLQDPVDLQALAEVLVLLAQVEVLVRVEHEELQARLELVDLLEAADKTVSLVVKIYSSINQFLNHPAPIKN